MRRRPQMFVLLLLLAIVLAATAMLPALASEAWAQAACSPAAPEGYTIDRASGPPEAGVVMSIPGIFAIPEDRPFIAFDGVAIPFEVKITNGASSTDFTFEVPESATPGHHSITLMVEHDINGQATTSACFDFEVSQSVRGDAYPVDPAGSASVLPSTGTSLPLFPAGLLAAGAAELLVRLLLRLLGQRRRREPA